MILASWAFPLVQGLSAAPPDEAEVPGVALSPAGGALSLALRFARYSCADVSGLRAARIPYQRRRAKVFSLILCIWAVFRVRAMFMARL